MKNNCLTVLAQFEAKPGKERELEEMLTSLIAPTLQEDGCIKYDLHKSKNNPSHFLFYEKWTDETAFSKHINSTHVNKFQNEKEEVLARPFEVTFWNISS